MGCIKPEQVSALEEASKAPSPSLEDLICALDSAIDIFDQEPLKVRWNNHENRHQLTLHDQKLLRLLIEELQQVSQNGRVRKSAQRLDWDDKEKSFRYTRLYHVREYYALTRDWRKGETIHDVELFNLEGMSNLDSRLNAAALYLAKRYGITRLRVYKIAGLPHCTEYEAAPPAPLVMPLFQRGGGFKPDAKQWLRTGFLVSDNEATRRAVSPSYVCEPESVEKDERERIGCSDIEFGNAGTRVQFSVRDEEKIRALLAFDRRTDHLGSLEKEDQELAKEALRIAGVFDGPIGNEELGAMHGLLKDLGKRLVAWLDADEETRERKWHETISDILRDSLIKLELRRDAGPFDTLSSICASLLQAWKEPAIAGRVWGKLPDTLAYPVDSFHDPLSDWYLALAQGPDQWQAVAGAGKVYQAYHDHGSPLPMRPPHQQAFSAKEAWTPQPIQDFQAWRAQPNQASTGETSETSRHLDSIGAWLAVPMQLAYDVRALMVVHSSYRFHFTDLRSRLLREAARRLLPPLDAALRESRIRGAFTTAVMHEVKTDAKAALEYCEAMRTHCQGEVAQRLDMVRHYLEGLSDLGRDFLDTLRPGDDGPVRLQDDTQVELSKHQTVRAKLWLDNLLFPWQHWLYQEKPVNVRNDIGDQQINLAAPTFLRRVARVLLQNAYRHGEGGIDIELRLTEHEGRTCLQLCVTNVACASVAAGVSGGISAATVQIGPAPQARARVGLASALRLTEAVGGQLEIRDEPEAHYNAPSEDEPMHKVSARLYWPLKA